jgi:hypothetical protein
MANLQIDTSKTAAANLLAILNSGNTGQTITAAQVSIGAPSVKTDSGDGRNTSVVLTAQSGQGFSGSVTVNYTRRGLNDSVASPVDSLSVASGTDAATIVSTLATQLGLVASELHLEDPANAGVALSGPQTGNQATLNLVASTTSLLYTSGASQAITMTWTAEALSAAVTNVNLPGFASAAGTL